MVPEGRIERVSPSVKGTYYQPHIHPDGTQVVFFGNEAGPPRVWKADLANGNVIAFDVSRRKWGRKVASSLKRAILSRVFHRTHRADF